MTAPDPGRRPRVSVVTVFHDRAAFVRSSLRSVLEQSFRDFELIAVDDASSDDTLSELLSFDDPRLLVVARDANVGFVRNMIDAVASARGEIVAVHGAGDRSLERRLERQVATFDARPDVDLVVSHRRNVAPDGRVLSTVRPEEKALTFERLLQANAFSHGEVAYRKEAYDRVGGYRRQFRYAQDRDLWLRLAKNGRFAVVPEVLYERVVHEDGVSFVAEKIVRQAKYSQLAVDLARASRSEAEDRLRRVDAEGIDAAVPDGHPSLRRRLLRKTFVLGVAGRWSEALDLSQRVPVAGPGDAFARFGIRALCTTASVVDPHGKRAAALARVITGNGRGAA